MITKKLAKLALMIIISVNLSFFTNTAFADKEDPGEEFGPQTADEAAEAGAKAGHEYSEASTALNEAVNKPCIDINNKEAKDYNYVVTIIEEPYDIKDDETTNPELKYRICYRHTFTYVDYAGTVHTIPTLSKEPCLENAEDTVNELNKIEGGSKPIKKAGYFCREVQVILSKGGTAMIYGYIAMIYRWGAGLAGLIAVTIITISGVQISAAGGDPEAVGSAKKRILKSIGGLIVLFLSGLILYTINKNFFVS